MAAFYALTSAMYIYILIKYSDNFVKLLQLPTPKPPRACSFLSINTYQANTFLNHHITEKRFNARK